MIGRENLSVAVCAETSADLDGLVRLVRAAGSWAVVPIRLPDRAALLAAHHTASAFVVKRAAENLNHAGCAEVVGLLGRRPRRAPLICIGREPAASAEPSCWLPSAPSPALLGALLEDLWTGGTPHGPLLLSPQLARRTDTIIGGSPAIEELHRTIAQLAPRQTPVIITGESGVGKELIARALHRSGPGAARPFIAINCAAIPEALFESELFGYQRGAFTGALHAHAGAFEAAHRGTLFLDEIGELPRPMQAKLLRVLETGEVQRIGSTAPQRVDPRLIVATNRNLEEEVNAGRFRADLYYRVRVYPIHVPPLRDRPEDIAPIVTHHLSAIGLREHRAAPRITPAALEKLISHPWPGNVRELVNVLERAALHAEAQAIDAAHIVLTPPSVLATPPGLVPYKDAKTTFERNYFAQLMRAAAGNVSLAAKLGKKTRKEVYDALRRLGLDPTSYRNGMDAPDE